MYVGEVETWQCTDSEKKKGSLEEKELWEG